MSEVHVVRTSGGASAQGVPQRWGGGLQSDISMTHHLGPIRLRGAFRRFSGEVVAGADPTGSTVRAEIELASIGTGNADRDNHLRSGDFLGTDEHATMTLVSTSVRPAGGRFVLAGDLTLRGVTCPVELDLGLGGFGPDAYGGTRAGFSATGTIKRSEFGVAFNAVLETGGMVLSDEVAIQLEIQLVLAR